MNRIYRLVWSAARGGWLVVHEATASRGKRGASVKVVAAAILSLGLAVPALAAPPAANALPAGGQVVAGQAVISQTGNTLNITQSTDKAILNWQSFNIGANAAVNFAQPGASSVALNRVTGVDPSAIYGSLKANGQVFLVNPNGVLFGPGAQVDVAGLVASTLNIRNEDFLAGNYRFTRDGATGSVVNQGGLVGKYIALLAPEVRNEGAIAARMGTVALAGGEAVTLAITGQRLVNVEVERAAIDTLIENRHLIQVDQGTVVMSAQSARELLGRVVNTGSVMADGITTDGGVIRLSASKVIDLGGTLTANGGANGKGGDIVAIADLTNSQSVTNVNANLSARGGAQSGDGGFIETSGSKLRIGTVAIDTSAANGKTGTWLLDPFDFTVASSGGDITGAALSSALASSNVTIQTIDTAATCTNATCGSGNSGGNGDIHINDTVSWSSNKVLTLSAWRDINVNSAITVSGSGGIAIEYGQSSTTVDYGTNSARFTAAAPVNLASGASFTSKFASGGDTKTYTVINDLAGLTAIDTNGTTVGANYVLGSNIVISSGDWTPIGNTVGPFQGIFEGLGHTISGIRNNPASVSEFVGFFGQTSSGALVQNIGITNVDLKGRASIGGLVGDNGANIHNAHSTGTIANSSGLGSSDVVQKIGGLLGGSSGFVTRSFSSANIDATAGDQADGTDPFAPTLGGGIGGLVGQLTGGKLTNVYATGSVNGANNVGGLVGHAAADIQFSYSKGAVSATGNVGGLVGSVPTSGIVPAITAGFWDTQTSGQSSSAAGTGKTTTEMKTPATFTADGWDTDRVWNLQSNSYPAFRGAELSSAPSAITISLDDSSRVYGDTNQPGLTGFGYTGTLKSGDSLTGATWGSALTSYLAAGTYAYSTTNLLVPQFTFAPAHTNADYTISWSSNSLTVTPRPITVTANASQSKVYNGQGGADPTLAYTVTTSSPVNSANPLVNGDSFSGALARATGSNAGLYAINQGSLAASANYTITYAGADFEITKKALAITGITGAQNKTYDGSTNASLSGAAALANNAATANDGKVVGTENVTLSGSAVGTFADKNFGTGKTVTVSGLSLAGAGMGNYTLNAFSTTADINKKALAITGITGAQNKTYDGSTAATLNGAAALANNSATDNDGKIVGTEAVTLAGAATGVFGDKNFGTGKTVTVSGLSLAGADMGNYTLNAFSTTADINKKALTITGITGAQNKTYDGSTAATLNGTAALANNSATDNDGKIVATETVTLTGPATGVFADKNFGTGKTVTVTGLTLGGADKDNYTLSATTTTADIAKKALNINGLTAGNKTYDGSTTASLSGTGSLANNAATANDGKVVGTENVTLTGTAAGTFADKNFGTGKTVTITGLSLGGTDNANYTLNAATTTANIETRPVTVTADDKSMDQGGAVPALTSTVSTATPLVSGDSLTGALTTTVTSSSAAGVYTGEITQGTLANANYSITFIPGTLTVNASLDDGSIAAQAATGIGQITGGKGAVSISSSGNTTTLTQTSNNLLIDWSSFGIPAQRTLAFSQPGASSVAVNRINSGVASNIFGSLTSNGIVFLINPNGLLFGPGASLDVGGLVASAMTVKGLESTVTPANANWATIKTGTFDPARLQFTGTGGNIDIQSNMTMKAGSFWGFYGNQVNVDGLLTGTGASGASATGAGWKNSNTLTLSANSDVDINARMTLQNNTRLVVETGQGTADGGGSGYTVDQPVDIAATGSFATRQGSGGALAEYTLVADLAGLRAMSGNVAIGADIDAGATAEAGQGFVARDVGNLAGLGHKVSGLTGNGFVGTLTGTLRDLGSVGGAINAGGQPAGGLVGSAQAGATISNSYATGAVEGAIEAGGLVGRSQAGATISNSYATGAVNGASNVGGLVGGGNGATISNSYATGAVTGSRITGGLVGGGNGATISNSYATGAVTGSGVTGGLVGSGNFATISDSYATGAVTGGGEVGGLVGAGGSATISNSHATGAVKGFNFVGGLAGSSGGTISRSYATGTVTISGSYAGGLVGDAAGATISNSYATGAVTTDGYGGGLLGLALDGTISNSYASGTVTGRKFVGGLVGDATGATISNSYASGAVKGNVVFGSLFGNEYDAQISNSRALSAVAAKTKAAYSGFDFTNIWAIDEGTGTPYLRNLPKPGSLDSTGSSVSSSAVESTASQTIASVLSQVLASANATQSAAGTQSTAALASNVVTLLAAARGAGGDASTGATQTPQQARGEAVAAMRNLLAAACSTCSFSDTAMAAWVGGEFTATNSGSAATPLQTGEPDSARSGIPIISDRTGIVDFQPVIPSE